MIVHEPHHYHRLSTTACCISNGDHSPWAADTLSPLVTVSEIRSEATNGALQLWYRYTLANVDCARTSVSTMRRPASSSKFDKPTLHRRISSTSVVTPLTHLST
jgi:hypothetical protein